MLCSKCGEKIRPVVALDIDGVLGDYHGHFLRFATTYFGKDLEALLGMSVRKFDGSERFSTYCCRELGITLADYRECKLAYRQGGMKRSMPINQDATWICSMVQREAELWITTTRPYLSLDGVIKDTLFWLELHDIQMDGLLFDADKYAILAEQVDPARVVAVLDDFDAGYDAAESIFGEHVPILYANGFNDWMKLDRNWCDSLRQAGNVILDRAVDWSHEYA